MLDAGGSERLLPVRAPRAAAVRGGPTVTAPPNPDTGMRYLPRMSPRGYCRLAVRAASPGAEVSRLTLTPTAAEIAGRLVGVPSPAAVRFLFQPGDGGTARRVTPAVIGDAFRVGVPLADLGSTAAERIWEVWAEFPGHDRLRAGRFLHDVREPHRIFRVPDRVISPRQGVLVALRPHYTATGGLNLACRRLPQ